MTSESRPYAYRDSQRRKKEFVRQQHYHKQHWQCLYRCTPWRCGSLQRSSYSSFHKQVLSINGQVQKNPSSGIMMWRLLLFGAEDEQHKYSTLNGVRNHAQHCRGRTAQKFAPRKPVSWPPSLIMAAQFAFSFNFCYGIWQTLRVSLVRRSRLLSSRKIMSLTVYRAGFNPRYGYGNAHASATSSIVTVDSISTSFSDVSDRCSSLSQHIISFTCISGIVFHPHTDTSQFSTKPSYMERTNALDPVDKALACVISR